MLPNRDVFDVILRLICKNKAEAQPQEDQEQVQQAPGEAQDLQGHVEGPMMVVDPEVDLTCGLPSGPLL